MPFRKVEGLLKKPGTFFHSFSLVALANIITKPLWLILFIYAARKLGAYQFGVYTYSYSIVVMLAILIDFGLDYIAVRDVAIKNDQLTSFFNVVFLYRLAVTLLIGTGIIIYTVFLGDGNRVIIAALFIILLFQTTTLLLQFIRSLISSFHNFKLYSQLLVFEKLMIVVLGFISLFLSSNLMSFLIALLIGNITSCIYFVYLLKKHYKLKIEFPGMEPIRYLFKNSLPLVLMNVFIMAYFRVDVLILNWVVGKKEIVGIYGSIHRIIEMYFLIPAIIMSTAFPIISKKFNEDNSYISKLISNLLKFITVVSLPIVILIAFNSYNINYLLFGKEYEEGYKGLNIIIWTIIPLGYNYILGHVLITINKQKYCAISLSVASLINLILNFILIPQMSFMGTCIALLITEIIIFGFYSYYAEKFFGGFNIFVLVWKLSLILISLFGSFYLLNLVALNLYISSAVLLVIASLLLLKTKVLDIGSYKQIIMARSN
jgi:O-antigen/teichoic acid export membrane protein